MKIIYNDNCFGTPNLNLIENVWEMHRRYPFNLTDLEHFCKYSHVRMCHADRLLSKHTVHFKKSQRLLELGVYTLTLFYEDHAYN